MTDLQINIELARACGWLPSSQYAVMHGQYQVLRQILTCNKDGTLRKFDYRNPVIFDAIIAHWFLEVDWFTEFLTNDSLVNISQPAWSVIITRPASKRYEAAALVVIEIAKRGAK